MALREINVPPQYSDLVGGTRGKWQRVSLETTSDYDAASQLTRKFGIPFAAANSFQTSVMPAGSSPTAGTIALGRKDKNRAAVEQNEKFAVGSNIGPLGLPGPKIGGGGQARKVREKDLGRSSEETDWRINLLSSTAGRASGKPLDADTIKKLANIGAKAASGDANQFIPEYLKSFAAKTPEQFSFEDPAAQYVAPGTTGDFAIDPSLLRTLFPQGEGGMEGTDANLTDAQKALFNTFDYGKNLGASVDVTGADRTREERSGGTTGFGESLGIDEIISMFYEDGPFGGATLGAYGEEILNPLLEELLLAADQQNNRVSAAQIADMEARSREKVAEFNKASAIEIARQDNLSDAEVARLTSEADTAIAAAAKEVDKYIADRQLVGTEAHATATKAAAEFAAGATKAAASSMAGGTKAAAESARLGQEAAAKAAAGATKSAASSMAGGTKAAAKAAAAAASPFGFMSQNYNRASRDTDLANIYEQLNAVGLAQAGASNIGAQDNAFSFAAGQAINPVTGELQFDPNQIAQIAANTPAAFAARGQVDAARAGATGFGALMSGDTLRSNNANAILRAQAANNAYAAQQLGQDEARIDQILRGGLSAEQRLAEINASQAGQNFANQLNFMSNPSAVGFATETGLLNDISNSPEGNIPGSLFGFNSPSVAGAGGNQTTNTGNFNANTLRNASDEQIGFLQGAASAGGQTPSEFNQQVESFTPQGL